MMKHDKKERVGSIQYHEIHMPKNTPVGFFIGVLSFFLAFGVIWYMFWLAILSALGILGCIILRLYEKDTEYYVTAEEVRRIEESRQKV